MPRTKPKAKKPADWRMRAAGLTKSTLAKRARKEKFFASEMEAGRAVPLPNVIGPNKVGLNWFSAVEFERDESLVIKPTSREPGPYDRATASFKAVSKPTPAKIPKPRARKNPVLSLTAAQSRERAESLARRARIEGRMIARKEAAERKAGRDYTRHAMKDMSLEEKLALTGKGPQYLERSRSSVRKDIIKRKLALAGHKFSHLNPPSGFISDEEIIREKQAIGWGKREATGPHQRSVGKYESKARHKKFSKHQLGAMELQPILGRVRGRKKAKIKKRRLTRKIRREVKKMLKAEGKSVNKGEIIRRMMADFSKSIKSVKGIDSKKGTVSGGSKFGGASPSARKSVAGIKKNEVVFVSPLKGRDPLRETKFKLGEKGATSNFVNIEITTSGLGAASEWLNEVAQKIPSNAWQTAMMGEAFRPTFEKALRYTPFDPKEKTTKHLVETAEFEYGVESNSAYMELSWGDESTPYAPIVYDAPESWDWQGEGKPRWIEKAIEENQMQFLQLTEEFIFAGIMTEKAFLSAGEASPTAEEQDKFMRLFLEIDIMSAIQSPDKFEAQRKREKRPIDADTFLSRMGQYYVPSGYGPE